MESLFAQIPKFNGAELVTREMNDRAVAVLLVYRGNVWAIEPLDEQRGFRGQREAIDTMVRTCNGLARSWDTYRRSRLWC